MELNVKFEFSGDGPCDYILCQSEFAKGHHYSYDKGNDGFWHYAGSDFLSQFVALECMAMDEVVSSIANAEDEVEEWQDHDKYIPKPECIMTE